MGVRHGAEADCQTSHDVCIRLMWLDASSAYVRFSLKALELPGWPPGFRYADWVASVEAFAPADIINAPFVVGAHGYRTYVLA